MITLQVEPYIYSLTKDPPTYTHTMSLLQNYTMMKLPKASGGLLLRTPTSTLGFSSRSALSNTLMSRAFSTSPNEKPERSTTFSKPSDVGMFWTRRLSADSDKQKPVGTSRRYHWVEEEATQLIAQAYKIHLPSHPFPPSVGFDRKRLEELKSLPHLVPTTFSDKVALKIVSLLESVMHMFFRKKYDHHAVTLETVAAVSIYSRSSLFQRTSPQCLLRLI